MSHSSSFQKPNTQQMTDESRAEIEATDAAVLTCQHTSDGVNRAVRKRLGIHLTDEIIAHVPRIFGEETQVSIEIGLMTADVGLVIVGEHYIATAGTRRGADTALALVPANAQQFFDLEIMKILAKLPLP